MANQQSPQTNPSNQSTEPERIVVEINRHWFGITILYVFGFLLTLLIFWVLAISSSGNQQGSGILPELLLAIGLIVLMLASFKVVSKIYYSNKITITNLKVEQVIRYGLLVSKSSVLGLGDIEDVTIHQAGLFAMWLDFGTLNIETAGEQMNFEFRYCPQPSKHLKLLVRTKEIYLQSHSDND